MADRKLLRLSATLLFIGNLFLYVGEYFHSLVGPGILPNNHTAEFSAYAAAGNWTAVHLGLFVATAIFIAGLLVLFFALNLSQGIPRWVGLFGAVSAGVVLALAGVDGAVDGVALKQAAVAWVSAPAAEQAARFASVEAIRWLEWGTKSYMAFMYGFTLLLFSFAIVLAASVPRLIGYLMGLYGITYLVQGWIIGTAGFPPTLGLPQIGGTAINLIWTIWLLIVAWRMKETVQATPR